MRSVAAAHLAAFAAVQAAAQDAAPREAPLHVELGFERVKLPADEGMGLLGASVLFPLGDSWWAGPAVYGAAGGQRGGLFVGGAELRRQWALPLGWQLGTGLYAGGGGGASAPVGGGLMLRAGLTATHDLGPLRAGVSWSHVRFPSGDIRSSQWGVVLSWDRTFRLFDVRDVGLGQPEGDVTGLGVRRLAATAGTYSLRGTDTRRVGMAGARAEWQPAGSGWIAGLEAAAAASGGAGGYMEILGTTGWRFAPWSQAWPQFTLDARVAIGLGGGGGVPTGGGWIGKGSVGASAQLGGGWRAGVEVGALDGLGTELRARTAQVWLAMDLEPQPGSAAGTVGRNEWSATVQRQTRARRRDGSSAALDTVGMKLNRFIGDHVYLSAQAHSAFAGGAGAYSVGLVGAGLATRPDAGTRFGAEMLVGTAAGGGVDTGGGAIVQTVAWAGWPSSAESQWRLGVGAVKSIRGHLRSPVLELSWTRAFGLGGS
jgi:hypothetical protein